MNHCTTLQVFNPHKAQQHFNKAIGAFLSPSDCTFETDLEEVQRQRSAKIKQSIEHLKQAFELGHGRAGWELAKIFLKSTFLNVCAMGKLSHGVLGIDEKDDRLALGVRFLEKTHERGFIQATQWLTKIREQGLYNQAIDKAWAAKAMTILTRQQLSPSSPMI